MRGESIAVAVTDDESDAALLQRTSSGDSEAYGSLYTRHVDAARRLARQLARDPSEADELVSESFARVLSILQRGGGPKESLRPYLLSSMRRLHIDRRIAERKLTPVADMTPHDSGQPFFDAASHHLEHSIVAKAYASLPERWRVVLWHTEIEQLTPSQAAPLLGISAEATKGLAYRARAGLRDAYLTAHIGSVEDPRCREVAHSLGGYVRGTLSQRARDAVDTHLEQCLRCKAAVLELSDTASTMRAALLPLLLGAGGLTGSGALLADHPPAPTSPASPASDSTTRGGRGGPLKALAGVGAGVAVLAGLAALLLGHNAQQARGDAAPEAALRPKPTIVAAPVAESVQPGAQHMPAPVQQRPPHRQPRTLTPAPPAAPVPPVAPQGSLKTVGDLVPGRSGILRVTVTNPDRSAVAQTLQVRLPAGITLDSAAAGAPSCRTSHGVATCQLGHLEKGATTALSLPVTVAASAPGGAWSATLVSTADGVSAKTGLSGRISTTTTGLNALWAGVGRYQVSGAGSALLTCQDAAHPSAVCTSVITTRSGGSLDDDAWTMYPVNAAGGAWTDSSTSHLTLPAGSTVQRAWLSWSASGVDPATADRTARFQAPGGSPTTVHATSWASTPFATHPAYVAMADVTAQVRAAGSGIYTAGDIALPTPATGTYGGWTLTVVTSSHSGAQHAVTVLSGPRSLGLGLPSWTGTSLDLAGHSADLLFEAWEGDAGYTGESLSVRGTDLAPLDGLSPADDLAASHSIGAADPLTIGVDVRALHANAGAGGQISVGSDGDHVILGLLAITTG